MFGWFAPRQPLPTAEKVLVERRMKRLAGLLGFPRLVTSDVVLPTPEFFPDPFADDEASADALLRRVCGYMGVDPAAVRLEVRPDDFMGAAAGLYEAGRPATIAVKASLLASPAYLIPVLAHELVHEILLGGGLLTTADPDHEYLTDLVPTFLGLGVLSANGTVYDASWSDGVMGWSLVGKYGYLTSREIGYALALFAFARGEYRPTWGGHLRPDAAVPFRPGSATSAAPATPCSTRTRPACATDRSTRPSWATGCGTAARASGCRPSGTWRTPKRRRPTCSAPSAG